MSITTYHEHLQKLKRWGVGMPLLLLLILIMLLLPLPPIMLDILFTANITISILVLFSGMTILKPLDFGVFPAVLLIATLMRLALNIAATRVILLSGHQGAGAAGEVIKAVGEVVVGGNTVVGFVIFSIFIIINFMVITKGASRISEVSARFTLDAMPGKQMAIDADLNGGLITPDTAQTRRTEVAQEGDFYGAMDGASKFIRGDAIAGLLIVCINWVGGIGVGFFEHDMGVAQALKTYALLTIGDGLAAQIPALILSTAAAITVTRVSSTENIGQQITHQLFGNVKTLLYAGSIMLGLGVLPGMPHGPFIFSGLIIGGMGMFSDWQKKKYQAEQQAGIIETPGLSWEDVALFDAIVIECGPILLSLLKEPASSFWARLQEMRENQSKEWGFVLPEPLIRENTALQGNAYRLLIFGCIRGEETLEYEQSVAINPEAGLADISIVLVTHLCEIIQDNIAQLLTQDAVQALMAVLRQRYPNLVEELVPKTLSWGVLSQVLRNLLQEQVSIRDLKTIAEALMQGATKTQDPEALTRLVRLNLGHLILQKMNGFSREMSAIRLSADLERLLQQSLQLSHLERMTIEPGLADQMQQSIKALDAKYRTESEILIFLVPAAIRRSFAQFVHSFIKQMTVLSYDELPTDQRIKIIATIGQ